MLFMTLLNILVPLLIAIAAGVLIAAGGRRRGSTLPSMGFAFLLLAVFVLLDRLPEYSDRFVAWGTIAMAIATFALVDETRRGKKRDTAADQEGKEPVQKNSNAKPDKPVSTPVDDSDRETYLHERESLLNVLLDQSRSFDKYVLTLAGGAFGLSLLFIKDVVPVPQPETMPLLITAWVSFGASIALTLTSFLLSQEACKAQIEIDRKLLVTKEYDRTPTNMLSEVTRALNWLSGLVFVAGIATLGAFAIFNMS